ncbi:tape measure protein [Paracoccus alkenifer]|uniref:Tape measure domain-containing protein n=1 Tax=Paracoccus alkenifer TaxID=65735 RepID=A0A1H6NB73_9RHOB|nr:tape measure protein [Paracoccus alkenifer]SEI10122.1 tape measure domain-containing protein [Paracoccus alkenifer]
MTSSVIGALRVNLGLDGSKFQGGLSKSEKALVGFSGRLTKMAAGLGATLGAAFTARAIGQAADQWSDLSSRVGNAVGSMDRAPEVMQRIQQMARQSYSELSLTTDAFAANSQALKDLGYDTQQQLDYTEALNNALVIGGAKGQHAAQVQDVLSKAMATNKLSGDGLNTVLARGGRVAQALADELGTNVSGLRDLGKQGKITGDVIARALLVRMQELRDEAEEMPATISDGVTLIRNSMVALVGTFDLTTGASGVLATALVGVADGLDVATTWISKNGDTIISVMNQMVGVASAAAAVFATRYAVSVGTTAVTAMRQAISQAMALEMALGATSRASALAGAASKALAGALGVLRGAVMSLGIPALVVGVGMAVGKFLDLSRAAGGFGNAFSLVMAAAKEEWARWSAKLQAAGAEFRAFGDGIKASIADAMAVTVERVVWGVNRYVGAYRGALEAIKAIWGILPDAIGDLVYQAANATIKGIEAMLKGAAGLIDKFTNSIAGSALGEKLGLSGTNIAGSINFRGLTNVYVGGMKKVGEAAAGAFKEGFETDIFSADGVAGSLRDMADEYRESADVWKGIAGVWSGIGAQPNEAWGAVKELVAGLGNAASSTADDVADLSGALEGVGGSGSGKGGGSGGRAASALDKAAKGMRGLADEAKNAQRQAKEWADQVTDAVMGVIAGTTSIKQAFASMLQDMASKLMSSGLASFFGSMFSPVRGMDSLSTALRGALSGTPRFATGGHHVGGLRIVGERGPELEATGPARYFTAAQTQQMLAGGGGGGAMGIHITASFDETGNLYVKEVAQREAASMGAEINRALPARVQQINANPRRRP